MTPSAQEAHDIVSALRTGVVPLRGLEHVATGLERLEPVLEEELDQVSNGGGRGLAKWIRGNYGSGKTFATRFLCAKARGRGFATSEVQISVNDTPLYNLEAVYRRLIERLETAADGTGAFKAVIDGWLYELGEEVTRLKGIGEDDPTFPTEVEQRLEDRLAEISRRTPAFAQVLRAYHRALQEGDIALSQQLLAWLGGQPQVHRSVLAKAGVKGDVDGQAALAFLRGLLLLLRQSRFAGLVVVLDEVETLQRLSSQHREKSFNVLRQLVDMLLDGDLPGLYLVVTGTPDFFDGTRGVKSLPPLHQRVVTRFDEDPRFDNPRAPQVRLLPFDEARLIEVGRKVRALFPARHPERVAEKADDAFLRALVGKVTEGFGGTVSVTPRTFLRELVDVLDRVDLNPEFDPAVHYKLQVDESALTEVELEARRGGGRPQRLEG